MARGIDTAGHRGAIHHEDRVEVVEVPRTRRGNEVVDLVATAMRRLHRLLERRFADVVVVRSSRVDLELLSRPHRRGA
jgi:hypothetical protein